MKPPKVIKVEYGLLNLIKITKESEWKTLSARAYLIYGIQLPLWSEIEESDKGGLVVLNSPWYIKVTTEKDGVFYGQYETGFYYDQASIPWWARSFIDNDDPRLAVAAALHDGLFRTQKTSFETANSFFMQIAILEGLSTIKAKIAFKAVSSKFGYRQWEKNELLYEKKNNLVHFEWAPN